jgi:hypothetical protein
VEKKIEKLVFAGDLIENELERIRIKINKIIEVLNRPTLINYPINTQPQAGVFTEFTDKNISDDIPKGFVDIDGKLHKFEYNPEKKKDWEEELGKLMSTWGKVLSVNKGRIGAGMQTAMYLKFYHFIKDLLLEREREVLNSMREWVVEYHKDNWDIRDFDAEIAIGKIIDRELSKLTTK